MMIPLKKKKNKKNLSSGINSSGKPLLTIVPFHSVSPPPSQPGGPLCSAN